MNFSWAELEKYDKACTNPELVRFVVNSIKWLESEHIRIPAHSLPADSFIRFVAYKIIEETKK